MEIETMTTTSTIRTAQDHATNRILHGGCIEAMRRMPAQRVDFILTDPLYLVTYRDRTGRTLANGRTATGSCPR
jgi:DNA modification methylase